MKYSKKKEKKNITYKEKIYEIIHGLYPFMRSPDQ